MPKLSPYRSLPTARRLALMTHALNADRGVRSAYVQRLVARGGGFRAETLKKWPVDQLAREIVRRGVEGPQDELQLLLLLYVEIEPVYQTTFLEATGVPHDGANIADDLPTPFADAATVKKAAESLIVRFGDAGREYLRTIALYNGPAWPGLAELVAD